MESKQVVETSAWKPTLHIVSWSMTALDEAGEDQRVIRAEANFQADVNLFSAIKTEPDKDISKIPIHLVLKCAEISIDPRAEENRKKELSEQNKLAGPILALEGPQTPIGYLTYSPAYKDVPLADEEFVEIVIGLRSLTFDSLWSSIRDRHPPTEIGLLVTSVPVSSRSAMHRVMKWNLD